MKRGSRAKPSTSQSSLASACFALILIDPGPARQHAREEYEKACRDVALARQKLEQFHKHDVPQFSRWLHQHFGAVLTELRDLRDRLMRNHELIQMIEEEVFFTGCNYRQAYKQVLEEMEDPDRDGEEDMPPPGGEKNGPESGPHEKSQGSFDQAWGEDSARGERLSPSAPKQPSLGSRVKELYRALVRRLHPDTQKEMTPQKIDWWHQTQRAYEDGDEDQLEIILAWCELESNTTATNLTSVSMLQRIIRQLNRSARALKRELHSCRREPAWNFSQCNRTARRTAMEVELQRDLVALRAEFALTEKQLAAWKKKQPRRPAPTRRRHGPKFDFF